MVGGKLVAIVELIGPVASGVLGDDARGFDHGERHPIFHAARGVLAFELQQDARAVRRHDIAERD